MYGIGTSRHGVRKEGHGTGSLRRPARVQSPRLSQPDLDSNNFKVDHPEQFPLATAGEHVAAPELNVTGVVSPDVSRQVPVPSLATGRIVEIDARLGDEVKKGQVLFKVRSTDIAGAFSDYRQAVKNEELSKIQLTRANTLFEHGAIPKSAQEIAQNAEDDNASRSRDREGTTRTLRGRPRPSYGYRRSFSSVSGTITDQEITNQSGVQALTPPNPFTISDLSHVWIICDVWENNMAQVHIGEYCGDPSGRVSRPRFERSNQQHPADDGSQHPHCQGPPGSGESRHHAASGCSLPRRSTETRWSGDATVPSTAILHLHDREWVYTPLGDGRFRRLEVVAGSMLFDNRQEIISGIKPGDQAVSNALVFQNTVEQ